MPQLNPIAIIPARYASTRFPGKPLALLGGKPIIQHVVERVQSILPTTIVATDDERIFTTVESFGGRAVMTSPSHRSGTDRCREALDKIGSDYNLVVNVQGDEPFVHPTQLRALIDSFSDAHTQIATLVKPFATDTPVEDLENPNTPKVVVDGAGYALYFSRSVVPYLRGIPREEWLQHHTFYKHIGLYAYRSDVLRRISELPPSPLEQAESLEQLRWLEAGLTIRVETTDHETIGIDTLEDLQKAQIFLMQQP